MKFFYITSLFFCFSNCQHKSLKSPTAIIIPALQTKAIISYDSLKLSIHKSRKQYALQFPLLINKTNIQELTYFWVKEVDTLLYNQWQGTPWDFNGHANKPGREPIACGYFVTTILRDMDCKIARNKLAICPSSVMMQTLAPHQKLKNLSFLSYADFDKAITSMGKGVYIIGLDYHTGFIINDGKENWFVHSNYVNSKGVTKEKVLVSSVLRYSKTRWMISLTGDREFLQSWLR